MRDKILFFVAGFFVGIAELLPGISGATVALMFGVYKKIISFINNFKGISPVSYTHLTLPTMQVV